MFIRTLNQACRLSNNVIFSTDDEEMLDECKRIKNITTLKDLKVYQRALLQNYLS